MIFNMICDTDPQYVTMIWSKICDNDLEQAGAELGQAQVKLEVVDEVLAEA